MKNQLLLLEDVEPTGRKGEIVKVKAGFARNFLIPKKKAVIADKTTIKLQEKLKIERDKQAQIDRESAVKLADELSSKVINTEVKVDPDGKLYGSVSAVEVTKLLKDNGIEVEKRQVILSHPIRSLGVHNVTVKLNEGVLATVKVEVTPEGGVLPEKVEPPKVEEEQEPKAE